MIEQEESIYNLIPRQARKQEVQSRYLSKFKSNVKADETSNKADYKTMGQAKVPMRGTQDFLKKHEKQPNLPPKKTFKYPDEERRRPTVPTKDDQPILGLKTTKNFITQNAVENIMSVAKKPGKNFVDTRKGDKQPLEPSGLEPKYIQKKEYGRSPEYLKKRKEEVRKAQEEYNAYVAEHFRRGAMDQLSDEHREYILLGLKSNWEQLHHEYQGLSVVTDTAPKKNRKERMEAEMKQLEKDIEAIEKHQIIYIAH